MKSPRRLLYDEKAWKQDREVQQAKSVSGKGRESNVEFLTEFMAQRWYVIAGALVILFLVIKLVKTVIKWVIILAIVAAVYFYGASYKDQLLEYGSALGTKVAADVKNQALKTVTEEAKEAKYTQNPDGTFTVKTKSVRIDGKPGASDVQVTFMNQTFTLKVDDVLKRFIEQAKTGAAG